MDTNQPKSLTMGKLVIGVALGVLLAGSVAAVVSVAWIEHDRSEQAAANITADFDRLHEARVAENHALDASSEALEAQIKELDPGSPCNVLVGASFTECGKLETAREKRDFVASKNPRHKESSRAAARRVLVSAKASNDAPVPLCKDVMKPGSSDYPTCRTE